MNNRLRYKLRVWSTKDKCFIDRPEGKAWAALMETDVWLSSYGNFHRVNVTVNGVRVDRPAINNEFIVQQCTGLRDIEGTIVFEGDIVLDCRDEHRGKPFVFKVVWDKGIAGFALRPIKLSAKMYSAQKISMSNISQTVVLGNHLQGYSLRDQDALNKTMTDYKTLPDTWGYYWLKRDGAKAELVYFCPGKQYDECGAVEVWDCPGIGRTRLIIGEMPRNWQWSKIEQLNED